MRGGVGRGGGHVAGDFRMWEQEYPEGERPMLKQS